MAWGTPHEGKWVRFCCLHSFLRAKSWKNVNHIWVNASILIYSLFRLSPFESVIAMKLLNGFGWRKSKLGQWKRAVTTVLGGWDTAQQLFRCFSEPQTLIPPGMETMAFLHLTWGRDLLLWVLVPAYGRKVTSGTDLQYDWGKIQKRSENLEIQEKGEKQRGKSKRIDVCEAVNIDVQRWS